MIASFKIVVFFLITSLLQNCQHQPNVFTDIKHDDDAMKEVVYLALGDSYTIGHNVEQSSSFPYLLMDTLLKAGYHFKVQPKVIAKTGWKCEDLLKNITDQNLSENSFNLITLLIGVNDQYQKEDINFYPSRFTTLLNKAILLAGNKEKVIVLSIPDYGITPFGKNSNPAKISKEIQDYNAINKKIATDMGIKYVNITDISLKAENDLSYLANDKLHPSEKMYSEWIEAMYPNVIKAIKN